MASAVGEGRGLTRSVLVLAALAVLTAMQPTGGCDPVDTETAPLGAGEVLADAGPEVVIPALARFEGELEGLAEAVATWADRAGTEAGPVARDEARAAFAAATTVWQELELMQVGPAASALTDPGGRDLRDEVYSWPTASPCKVDQETVAAEWDRDDFFTTNLVNAYGLDALEHLLYAGPEHTCPGQVGLDAGWDALGDVGLAEQRADYAVRLVDGVQEVVVELQQAWSAEGEAFGDQLASPGSEGSPYATEREALTALFDAMFYLETVTKDRKLAEPLGCESDCADTVEGAASGLSLVWVAANLRGFRAVFRGGEGQGFDDLLDDLGHGDLGARVRANTDEALALAEGTTRTLDEVLVADRAQAESLYTAVQRITDDLKGDLAVVLELRLPSEAAGDND